MLNKILEELSNFLILVFNSYNSNLQFKLIIEDVNDVVMSLKSMMIITALIRDYFLLTDSMIVMKNVCLIGCSYSSKSLKMNWVRNMNKQLIKDFQCLWDFKYVKKRSTTFSEHHNPHNCMQW
jgi:hypothetical protein